MLIIFYNVNIKNKCFMVNNYNRVLSTNSFRPCDVPSEPVYANCNSCTTNKYQSVCPPMAESSGMSLSILTGNTSNDDCSGNIAIDAQEGLWSEFVIGPSADSQSGLGLNYKIPFGFVDYRDLGRSGICDTNNLGRVYSDESGNTYQYGNYKLVVRDCNQKVIYNEDTRIPVEALSPYDLCANITIDPLNPCASCPTAKVLTTICENGVCKVKWVNPAVVSNYTYNLTVTDTPTVDLTLVGTNLKADVKLSTKPGNNLSIDTDGLFSSGGYADNISIGGNGTIITPFAIKKVFTDQSTVIGTGIATDPIRINPCPGLKVDYLDYSNSYRQFTHVPVDYKMKEFADEAIGLVNVNQLGDPTNSRIGYKTIEFTTPAMEGNCPDYWWYAQVTNVLSTATNALSLKLALSHATVFYSDVIAIGPDAIASNIPANSPYTDIRNAINTGNKVVTTAKVITANGTIVIPSNQPYGDSQGNRVVSTQYLMFKPNTKIEMVNVVSQALPNNTNFTQLSSSLGGTTFELIFESTSLFIQYLGKIKKI